MRRAFPRLSAFVLLTLAGVTQGTSARADDRADEKQACASAAEEAEQMRIDARLLAARERLLRCSRPECPAAVRSDCAGWMSEVVAAMPTVVLAVRDVRGQDVLGALASVDGVPIAHGLDGKAIEVDPGAHTFRFEAAGISTKQVVLVREGEKSRAVTATLDLGPAAPAAPVGSASSPEPAAPSASTSAAAPTAPSALASALAPAASVRVSPWTWAFGSIGVVTLAVGAYLELSVNADASDLKSSCGHSCSHAQVDPLVLKQQVLGPIAFGVCALSLGLAGYTLLATPVRGGAVAGMGGPF